MRLPALIITDLHLTAKPRDEYRWGLFPWLHDVIKEHSIRTLLILGDLTDAKDFHSSELVNRIVRSIMDLASDVGEVIILMGNHDYLKEGGIPFFAFLGGLSDKVTFVSSPLEIRDGDVSCLFLPHTKDIRSWTDFDFTQHDFVFMHQTVNGAIASNGQRMGGELAADFNTDYRPVIQIYSGDIHVPQDIGSVRYVGSPYHVHFGDKFIPRCIVLDKEGREKVIRFETIQRVTLSGTIAEVTKQLNSLEEQDQVKIRVELDPVERSQWDSIKRDLTQQCISSGIDLHGLELLPKQERRITVSHTETISSQKTHTTTVSKFVEKEGMGGEVLEAGLRIVES